MSNKYTSIEPEKPMATIETVGGIEEINGATEIELVVVKGWRVVAKKKEFNVGDKCIYFVIGSIFPETYDKTLFLQNKPLKTKTILGSVSQGLVAPLYWIYDFDNTIDLNSLLDGDDVTKIMNIKKVVHAEEILQYKSDSTNIHFPSFIQKTDEERIQNCPHILDKLVDKEIVITRKEDGCSCTYFFNENKFGICSRNYQLLTVQKGGEHYFLMEKKYDIENKMRELGKNIAIQGEIIGPKISGNRMKLSSLSFKVFNIYDIDTGSYLDYDQVISICAELNLEKVLEIYKGIMNEEFNSVKKLLEFVETVKYYDDPKGFAEGIVIKSLTGYPRISFKVISNKYLVKYQL
jgi:RNA ligase (TIGR02306 family)